MTTIYVPQLIESAEQAEALGGKTPIHIVLDRTQEVHDVKLFEDFAEDFWLDALDPGNRWVYIALVPIEAEENVQELHGIKKTVPWGELIEITCLGINETADSRDWRRHAYWARWEEA